MIFLSYAARKLSEIQLVVLCMEFNDWYVSNFPEVVLKYTEENSWFDISMRNCFIKISSNNIFLQNFFFQKWLQINHTLTPHPSTWTVVVVAVVVFVVVVDNIVELYGNFYLQVICKYSLANSFDLKSAWKMLSEYAVCWFISICCERNEMVRPSILPPIRRTTAQYDCLNMLNNRTERLSEYAKQPDTTTVWIC